MLCKWLGDGVWRHNGKEYRKGDPIELADDFLKLFPSLSNQLEIVDEQKPVLSHEIIIEQRPVSSHENKHSGKRRGK